MSNSWREYGRYGTVGIELVLFVMLGYFAGGWIDAHVFGGHEWGAIIGLGIGTLLGFRQVFRAATYIGKDVERAEKIARGENPYENEVPMPRDSSVASSRGRDKTSPR